MGQEDNYEAPVWETTYGTIGNDSSYITPFPGLIYISQSHIRVNDKIVFDGTEKLNEVFDISACVYKNGLSASDLQKVIDKGYTLVLN